MNAKGFTMLELLVSLALIAMLGTIGIFSYKSVIEKSKKAKCMSHMRSLHAGLTSAIQEKGQWPQLPFDGDSEWSEDKFFEWWMQQLAPYGIGENVWICPSDTHSLTMKKMAHKYNERATASSYVPSNFEGGATDPFRYNQPWVLERGDFHKSGGGHMVMPDGSITNRSMQFPGR